MERYGDYNEIDEAPGKNPVVLVIKIVLGLVCLAVVGLLGFRMFVFNYYPSEMKSLYFTDSLAAYYEERGGDIYAETQKLRYKYDDAEEGNFFADNLILVREAGQLQLSVRYNKTLLDKLSEKYGREISPSDFIFSLAKTKDGYTDGDGELVTEEIGTLRVQIPDESLMYGYFKLAFDGVDFRLDEGEAPVAWIRLEVRIAGDDTTVYPILVYENHEGFAIFDEYKLSAKEKPENA